MFDGYMRDLGSRIPAGPVLLYVNVTWCGYCKTARPILEKVAQALGSVVPVYSVDGDARQAVAKSLGVKSYPTIVLIGKDGARSTFQGERTMDAIVGFVCSKVSGCPRGL